LPAAVAVTVWAPAAVAVQELPLHEPLGAIANVVEDVTSPMGFPPESKASTVYGCEPPAAISEADGLTTM
jgi:hypothetical protein